MSKLFIIYGAHYDSNISHQYQIIYSDSGHPYMIRIEESKYDNIESALDHANPKINETVLNSIET